MTTQEDQKQDSIEETSNYWKGALARATFLNQLKNQVRDVTKALDTAQCVFDHTLEAASLKHEVTILLSELEVHGLLPTSSPLTPQEYRKEALRTLYPDLSYEDRLGLCGLGLSGELGEVIDMLKKYLYHRNGKALDTEKMKDELGDVMWYFFILLDTVGITFEEVLETNVAKCRARHPNGFTPRYASDSNASV